MPFLLKNMKKKYQILSVVIPESCIDVASLVLTRDTFPSRRVLPCAEIFGISQNSKFISMMHCNPAVLNIQMGHNPGMILRFHRTWEIADASDWQKSTALKHGEIPKRQREIFLRISPFLKMVIPPPLWDTTIPTALVTCVIAATELWRVPMPLGRETLLVSTVIYRLCARM